MFAKTGLFGAGLTLSIHKQLISRLVQTQSFIHRALSVAYKYKKAEQVIEVGFVNSI